MHTITYSKERSNANRATWLVTQPGQGKGKTKLYAVHHNVNDGRWWAERLGPTTGRPDICNAVLTRALVGAVRSYVAAHDEGLGAHPNEGNPHPRGTVMWHGWNAGACQNATT